MSFPRIFCFVTAFVTLSIISVAQTTISTGSINGTVTDPSGAVVVGAKVTITNKDTGQAITTASNSSGIYTSGTLLPGNYSVRVESQGYKTSERLVPVRVNSTTNGNFKLEIGESSQVVQVEASSAVVNTAQAEVQGVLTAQQIENLPVNGRNFLDLAQLEPGVQIQDGTNFDPTKVGYSSISFGGRFGRTARIEVDGVDVSDETVGTTTQDIPASSIQEFSLAQSNLDLSNELTSSGAVNVVTKSGTNDFHGEGFGLFRDSSIAAALPHPPGLSSPFQRNQEGGSFGGPLIKNKLFFFADGERTLQHLQAPVLEPAPFAAFSGTFGAPFNENELQGRLDYQFSGVKLFYRFNYFNNSTDATFFPSSFQVYNNKNYTRQHVVGADFGSGHFTHSVRFSYMKFQNQIVDATRGTSLPFANFPVSINIGPLSTGPNLLAPQSTPQSNHQVKYDGSIAVHNHMIRFGATYNHIQGGGFASFFKITPNVFSSSSALGCTVVGPTCPAGPDGTTASNPLNYLINFAQFGNGQGFSTENPALGFPAGGLGPDNRVGLYIGDVWKIRRNLTLTPGLRWVRDTGRTDSDLPAIPEVNAVFPGFGNRVHQPNLNFAPQLGIAWDPKGDGKTVIRAGGGMFYENVIFNNVLFDRPLRLRTGAFLQFPIACSGGAALPVSTQSGTLTPNAADCAGTIGQAAAGLAAFQATYQAQNPFNLSAPNPNFIGNSLNGNPPGCNPTTNPTCTTPVNIPIGWFDPNYKTPISYQMNVGFQREIRHGMVFTADYLRNVTTRLLLGVDINHVGDSRFLNMAGAQAAIASTLSACGASSINAAIANCSALNGPGMGVNMTNFAGFGLTSSQADFGGPCTPTAVLGAPCAFSGINPNVGAFPVLMPVGRSVYNGLQMKLQQTVSSPMRGVRQANFQVSYALSRFVNPMGFQTTAPPSTPVANSDQDFVIQASDYRNPDRFTGPSLLDRTNQISFGGTFDFPGGFRFGIIGHFYSPLSMPSIVGATGATGDIFRTDFTGDGTVSDPLPGTTNGSFGRDFGVSGLNQRITNFNTTMVGQPTPAGQALISNGLFTLAQLQALGGVIGGNATGGFSPLSLAPSNQLPFTWLKDFDFSLSYVAKIKDRVSIQPSVSMFNIFNFGNFNLPPGVMNGWLNSGAGSINSTPKGPAADTFRVGAGTGVFALGQPRVFEFGLKVSF
jgi:hypothetical protein